MISIVAFSPHTARLTTRFLAEFQAWILTDFARADRSVEVYDLIPDELADLLRPWVEIAAHILGKELRQLPAEDARVFGGLFNHALDRIQRHCDRRGQGFADILLDLSPLDDLLMALSLVEHGLIGAGSLRTYRQAMEVGMNLARGARYFQGRLPFTSIEPVLDRFERWFFGRFLEAQQAVACGTLEPIALTREASPHIAELRSVCTLPNVLTPRDAYIAGCLLLYIQVCIANESTGESALAALDDLLTLLALAESGSSSTTTQITPQLEDRHTL